MSFGAILLLFRNSLIPCCVKMALTVIKWDSKAHSSRFGGIQYVFMQSKWDWWSLYGTYFSVSSERRNAAWTIHKSSPFSFSDREKRELFFCWLTNLNRFRLLVTLIVVLVFSVCTSTYISYILFLCHMMNNTI